MREEDPATMMQVRSSQNLALEKIAFDLGVRPVACPTAWLWFVP